jgi:methylated-DNA-[protein]-cysteine S-methyltransferase
MENLICAYYKSPIGVIRLEGNEDGVSFVDFIDEEVGKCETTKLPKPVEEALIQLEEYFQGKRKDLSIKLIHKRGTEFQKKVWKALQSIPYGTTASYKDVAVAIDNPKAVRAVGGANNKNPHSLFVP